METLDSIIEEAYQKYLIQSRIFDYLGMPECLEITKNDIKNSFKNGYLKALQSMADNHELLDNFRNQR